MLKEYLNTLRVEEEVIDPEERELLSLAIFSNLLGYLGDEVNFPNKEINKLAALVSELIVNGHIPCYIDPTGEVSCLFFAVVDEGIERHPMICVPTDFIETVAIAPQVLIGTFAFMASQCRDYFFNKITKGHKNVDEVVERAEAFEAETLILLKKIAREEGLELEFIPYQEEMIEKFPKGLDSLKPELSYHTPSLDELTHLSAQNSKLN